MTSQLAVIAGFGAGLGENLAVSLHDQDYTVIGLSRSGRPLSQGDKQTEGVINLACDIADAESVTKTFDYIRDKYGSPDLLIHNTAALVLDDFLNIKSDDFERVWRISCLSAFLVTQEVLPGMLEKKQGIKRGTIIYTGATASVKPSKNSAAFGSAKFALRGLAQSLARAYGPQGIHVVHAVIDGVIWGQRAEHEFKMSEEKCMQATDIAETYMSLIAQKPSSWTHELDLRPLEEAF